MGDGGEAIEMGAGQGWAGLNARVSVGHPPFWEPAQPPPGAPAGCRDTWSVQDRSICPTTSAPLMPSTLPSPAPSAPYGNDLLLPDLADTHGSPSAYATTAPVVFSARVNEWLRRL